MKKLFYLVLLFSCFAHLSAEDYWGLRNINVSYSDDVYIGLNPQYVAWGFVWDRLERPDDSFNWTYIDQAVDFTAKHNAKAVLLLTPASSWATDGEPKAPIDLDRRIPLEAEVPERGYSEYLYDYVYKIIDRIAKRNPNVLGYLRYGNEPQYADHWKISDQTFKRDVEDFIRCLRTVYKAAHKAANDNRASILVSHGGFYYNEQLERIWFEYGEANPDAQDSIIAVFNSRYERQWPKDIKTWNDFTRRMQSRIAMPPAYWMDVIAGQTEWMDWFDIHYHFKPRYIFDDMMAFEKAVKDSGGTLKPWLAAEAAMQIEEAGNTVYEERFHAGDMVRKWIFGIDAGLKGICTPILGMPPDRFYGLYTEDDKRYLSADAYEFVHSLIHPADKPERFDSNDVITYRFLENEKIIDFIWLDAFFDTVTKSVNHKIAKPSVPEDKYNCRVFDILGNELHFFGFKEVTELNISQEPMILVWEQSNTADERKKYEPAEGYIYHGVGWNYKNSVPNYIEMMPDNQQPLLFQTMSAIPGTRGLTVEKVLQGLQYPWQDIDKQFVEYGVHFHKTQEEPYDSLFAFTDELDHYIDTLAIAFKQHGKPFFLRIGGEMSGAWNNYTPYTYPKAFRKLVLELRKRNVDNFATVWCYEPVAPADFADSTKLGWKWYPGDDVVDWYGLDVFPVRDFGPDEPDSSRNGTISEKGKSELFLKFARDKGYPVYINETTAHSEHIIPDSEDPGNVKGKEIWEHWFIPFFQFLDNHPEIKAVNYINLDWTPIERWEHWGDARLEINSYIKNAWIAELKKSKYIHKGYDIRGSTTNAEENFNTESNNYAYPNPFAENLILDVSNLPVNSKILIYDIQGRLIYSSELNSELFSINTKEWNKGLYILKIYTDSNVIVNKLMKAY